MALVEVQVPDIGDFDEVAVIELLVKPGDTVKAEQSLITVESDKASMEIPSSSAGVVKEVRVKIGDKVKQGSVVLVLEAAGAAAAPAPAPAAVAPAPASAPAAPVAAPVAAASASTGPVEVRVPDIGDFKDVSVIEVLVKPGDTIKVEQSLITVESDKASMEIPSAAAGVLKELKVKVGDKVNIGDLVALLEGSAAAGPAPQAAATPAPAAAAAPAAAPAAVPATAAVAVPPHEPGTPSGSLPHASPSVRKFARELGVPLDEIKGSGPKGRITQDDIQNFTKAVMTGAAQTKASAAKAPAAGSGGDGAALGLIPWPKVDFAKFGPIERKEMGRIKKISGANLLRNAIMIPAVTNHDDADITDLEAFRVSTNKENEKSGIKVTMLAFLIKACVAALKKFPEFNSSWTATHWSTSSTSTSASRPTRPMGCGAGDQGRRQEGRAADQPGNGRAGQEGARRQAGPGRDERRHLHHLSLGGIGGRYFTPIINAPEVAILGVCKSQMEPVWDGKAFQPRLMLPLSLTWDHRVIDGAAAARFNAYLGQILGDFRRVLL
jgi:pyruvate dehydrogenase E2 component (dihydrolipoamide acetyltransferase)